MKKILLTTTGLIALGMAPAIAADLPAGPTPKRPLRLQSTTGPAFTSAGWAATPRKTPRPSLRLSGGFAGGTAGYNWQTGNVVFGIEADAAWSDVGSTLGIAGIAAANDKIRDMGTVRGRIGYAFGQVLLYGTGGYAWADNNINISALGVALSDSHIHSGWTAGAGVEVMFAPKWSVKAEYLYRSFASQNYFAGPILAAGVASGTFNLNSVQVGVNYHF